MQIEVENNMDNRLEAERLLEDAKHSDDSIAEYSNPRLRHYLESMSSFFDNNNKLRFYQSSGKNGVSKFSKATILGHKYFNGDKESIPKFATDFSKLIQEKNLDDEKEKAIKIMEEQKIAMLALPNVYKEDIRRKIDFNDEYQRTYINFLFGEKPIEEYGEWFLSQQKDVGLLRLINILQIQLKEHYDTESLNGLPTKGLYVYIYFHDDDGSLNEFYDDITCQKTKIKIDHQNSLPIDIRKNSQFTIMLFVNEFDMEFIFESEDGNVFDTRNFVDPGAE